MDSVVGPEHRAAASRVRALLAAYEQKRELIALGVYQKGADPATDEAIAKLPALSALLTQRRDEAADFEQTVAQLRRI
jgi:flagellar biosynthesis/type III secretory pathway ATPase